MREKDREGHKGKERMRERDRERETERETERERSLWNTEKDRGTWEEVDSKQRSPHNCIERMRTVGRKAMPHPDPNSPPCEPSAGLSISSGQAV